MDEFTPGEARPATADDMYAAMVEANRIVGEQRARIAELEDELLKMAGQSVSMRVAHACVAEISDGWGADEEDACARQIEPIIRAALIEAKNR